MRLQAYKKSSTSHLLIYVKPENIKAKGQKLTMKFKENLGKKISICFLGNMSSYDGTGECHHSQGDMAHETKSMTAFILFREGKSVEREREIQIHPTEGFLDKSLDQI